MSAWAELPAVSRERLVDARLQLHWAAQVVASVGRTLLDPRPDDSHPNLTWMGESWLAGNPVEDGPPLRAALDTGGLAIQLLGASSASHGRLELEGRTLEEAYQWLERSLRDVLGRSVELSRERYDIPPHDVGQGRPFSMADPLPFHALRDWFRNADWALRASVDGVPDASDVRTWPHHFDTGALIVLEPGGDPATSPSIGLGMTPGDGSYAEPYYYVNPYPSPAPEELPEWAGPGRWHTDGWIGLVLTTPDIVETGDAAWQQAVTMGFLEGAIAMTRKRESS